MPQFQTAYNNRSSYYEVHVAGCKHLTMGATGNPYTAKFDYVNPPVESPTAKAAAADFEAGNEGCFTKLGPCAKATDKAEQPKVTRSESTTARFGRVVTYRTKIGEVTVVAERMVGASENFSVYSNVGRCGMSHVSHPGPIPGGHGVAARVAARAQEIVASGAHVKAHTLCTDKAACESQS